MKIAIGLLVSFVVGGGCRYFDIPVPSPPILPGALLVVAMTLGYTMADRALTRNKTRIATTKHLCGGPTGLAAALGPIGKSAHTSLFGSQVDGGNE